MLGDYGEVYVLDWGVARLVGTQVQRLPAALLAGTWRAKNEILGTPGYMAPEQVDDCDDVEQAADVYALGAVLFEILTLQRLHEGQRVSELIASTRRGADARCSVRAPERAIAPELEALVVRATALSPRMRPSARELHESLESFLDGAREDERRRLVSELHVRAADEAIRRAPAVGPSAIESRRQAVRSLSRAHAADPANETALRTLVSLLEKPLATMPAEVEAGVRAEEEDTARIAARALRYGRLSWLLYVPLVLWLGVRSWPAFWLAVASITGAVAVSWVVDRVRRPAPWMRTLVAVLSMLTIMPIATLFGPIVTLPALIVASLPSFVAHLDRPGRVLATIAACVAGVVPFVLDATGLVPQQLVFAEGAITVLPNMAWLPELETRLVLGLFQMTPIVTAVILLARLRRDLDQTRARVHTQLWTLRQLLPTTPAS